VRLYRAAILVGLLTGAAVAPLLGCSIPDRSLYSPIDAAGDVTVPPTDGGGDTSAPPTDSGGDTSAPPTDSGADTSAPPMDAAAADSTADAGSDVDAGPPGSLDPTFGEGGIATIPFPADLAGGGLAVQSDGRILYCGSTYDDESESTLLVLGRVKANGTSDSTFAFGAGHLTSLPSGYDTQECGAVAVSSADDFIVVTGWLHAATNMMFVARYQQSSGDVDPTFGNGAGIVPIFDNGIDSKADAIGLQEDGDTIVAGFQDPSGAIVRLTGDGSADSTFDPSPEGDASIGVTTIDAPVGNLTKLALLPNGDVLAAMQGPTVVLRFTAHGALDPTYGNNGVASADAGPPSGCNSMAVQPDGKAVCLGNTATSIELVRFMPDGGLDPSFGDGGVASTPGASLTPAGIALLDDGSFAVGLWSDLNDIGVARFTSTGALDTTFGNANGFSLVPVATSTSLALAVDGDGRILIAVGGVGVDQSVVIARFLP
jgi:uncharacterized delta-60 repeat protein